MKTLIHTVNQPDSDITTFILSCNRLEILQKTLISFCKTKNYITKMVIVDDSAKEGIFDFLVETYGEFCDIICFPKNRGFLWAMDFMVSYCDTPYIFYLEDDWKFIKDGYMTLSKNILEKYREIGTIDISMRTFEDEGFDSYNKQLIDNSFYYKKPWRISEKHFYWCGWCGSPNLKRRDDWQLLGRVEKWHAEWNIDRRFTALGFTSIYLKDKYVEHLGDECSVLALPGRRMPDNFTPEDYYPQELKKNRKWPIFDYHFLEHDL